jgi:hypothetical protein
MRIESRVEPDWRVGSLPILSYSHDLRITAKQGEKIVLYRGVEENITGFGIIARTRMGSR